MANIFNKDETIHVFKWENLGNIKEGRTDLGEEMPVLVYRLMQFTMLDVLTKDFGPDKANEYFRRAGYLAGSEFVKNNLDTSVDFSVFVSKLQELLIDYKIGILRIEEFDDVTNNIVLTVAQDLDCSGLPITNETVCNYDEGFLAGILDVYTGAKYKVEEIECWATGDRVCRFNATVTG
ncbi:MAG: 4-vinyl reductase [Clostridiales Family XIII bacterium]|jgi:predicted hydrocarbon binding protein|nr:4-vinyl reductase [Clostridiales Family XIII bacterium]